VGGGEVRRQETGAAELHPPFLASLDYPNKDPRVAHAADPLIVGAPKHMLNADEDKVAAF
jgi:hypothetical protein